MLTDGRESGPSRFATQKIPDIEFESSFSFRFMLMAVLVERL